MSISIPFPATVRRGRALLALLILLGCQSLGAAEPLIAEARGLVEQGQAAQAHALLAGHEDTHAGDPEFDYWLGLAAVRSGQPSLALFPLERVLSREPLNAAARIELLGAYMQLGQRENAIRELERLERLDPPARAREAMDQARRELELEPPEDDDRAPAGLSGHLGLEVGHDSNPGSWPDTELELLPGITGEISPEDTTYTALQGGLRHRVATGARQDLVFSAQGLMRGNHEDEAEQFDLDFLQLGGEWGYRLDDRRGFALGLEGSELRLDGDHYRRMTGLWGEWRHRLRDDLRYTAQLGWRDMDFEVDRFDHDQWRADLKLHYQLSPRWRTDLELQAAYEDADDERPGEDARRERIRLRGFYIAGQHHRLGADLSYRWVHYSEDYEPFESLDFDNGPQRRRDETWEVGAQWEFFPAAGWLIRARVQHRDQDSTLDLFDYDQTQVSLGLNLFFQ